MLAWCVLVVVSVAAMAVRSSGSTVATQDLTGEPIAGYIVDVLECFVDNNATVANAETIRLGIALTSVFSAGREIKEHVEYAIHHLNDKSDGFWDHLLPNHTIQPFLVDTFCDEELGRDAAFKLSAAGVVAAIGGTCSSDSTGLQSLFKLFHVPQVSMSATASALSSTELYPLFARTVVSDAVQGRVLAELCAHFGWNHVALVTHADDYSLGIGNFFKNAGEASGVAVETQIVLDQSSSTASTVVAELVTTNSKIIILAMFMTEARMIMEAALAEQPSLFDPSVAFVGVDGW